MNYRMERAATVTCIARNHINMQMVNRLSRQDTMVYADSKPPRSQRPLQCFGYPSDRHKKPAQIFFGNLQNGCRVAFGQNKRMAGRTRMGIQKRKRQSVFIYNLRWNILFYDFAE